MPFKSRSQLRTCYGMSSKRRGSWDCDSFLEHTPSICCLPEKKGLPRKTRCMRNGERTVGPIQTGPKGGKFFIIEEKDNRGTVCMMRVYVPRNR